MRDFIEIENLNQSVCLKFIGGKGRAVESKRKDLPYLPEEWQTRFLNIIENDPIYRYAGVLLRYCGLRPIELAKSVILEWAPDGMRVTIFGGKVRETAGQPWRSFKLNTDVLPVWFVNDLKAKNEIVVSVTPDSLRSFLNRLSDQVFKHGRFKGEFDVARKRRYILSSYTFRHSFVTDLRESGWDTDTIAAVIGETSAQTVSYYGIRRRPGSRKPPIVALFKNSVRTARSVRPIVMSSLNSLIKSKANSARKKS